MATCTEHGTVCWYAGVPVLLWFPAPKVASIQDLDPLKTKKMTVTTIGPYGRVQTDAGLPPIMRGCASSLARRLCRAANHPATRRLRTRVCGAARVAPTNRH